VSFWLWSIISSLLCRVHNFISFCGWMCDMFRWLMWWLWLYCAHDWSYFLTALLEWNLFCYFMRAIICSRLIKVLNVLYCNFQMILTFCELFLRYSRRFVSQKLWQRFILQELPELWFKDAIDLNWIPPHWFSELCRNAENEELLFLLEKLLSLLAPTWILTSLQSKDNMASQCPQFLKCLQSMLEATHLLFYQWHNLVIYRFLLGPLEALCIHSFLRLRFQLTIRPWLLPQAVSSRYISECCLQNLTVPEKPLIFQIYE